MYLYSLLKKFKFIVTPSVPQMFKAKFVKKDRLYYCAFKAVIEQYDFIVESPAHSVLIYQHMMKNQMLDRSHCFMKKVSILYNDFKYKPITNYGAAQYYYKTFNKHLENYKGEGALEQTKPGLIDFDQEISIMAFNDFFD